ncbi:MAG: YCF48-related protein [Bacteroidota bacterium]|nr:YCF48-related protein [Bacteroidota bacterium]
MKKIFTQVLLGMICITASFSTQAQKWTAQTSNTTERLTSVSFANTKIGWAVGKNGTVLKTTNGGQTWTSQSIGTTDNLRDVIFKSTQSGWVCSDSGNIYITKNGGTNWTKYNSGVSSSLSAMCMVDTLKGWVAGPTGVVRKTTNGGKNWSAQTVLATNYTNIYMLDSLSGWITGVATTGKQGFILHTKDGGKIWKNYIDTNVTTGKNFYDVNFANSNTGWYVGASGLIRNTKNGGATRFSSQTSGITYDLVSICMLNTNTGWTCGKNGSMLSTTDGGTNWNAENANTNDILWSVTFLNDSTGWAVGDNGTIISYSKAVNSKPLSLYNPNGGEGWTVGSSQSIIWNASSSINKVDIYYSTNHGQNWTMIQQNITASTNSYTWTVPNTLSTKCLVRVVNTANTSEGDTSDADFTIINQPTGQDYTVFVTAQTTSSSIKLDWLSDANALYYKVYRKSKTDSLWTYIDSLSGSTNTYSDASVKDGEAWEYWIKKTTVILEGNGYIYAGINLTVVENRGWALILVDKAQASSLSAEIKRYEADLIGDGYSVYTQTFSISAIDSNIKKYIKQFNTSKNGQLSSVIILGHLAVPYSGNFAPDGHTERVGAQPADVYYADLDGTWTDNTITSNNKGTIHNPNTIGDGRWDQSFLPSNSDIYVGRIDMNNLPGFNISETQLLKRYMDKNHNYRIKNTPIEYRGLLYTKMDNGRPFTSAGGWAGMNPLFGYNALHSTNWNMNTEFLDSIKTQHYQFAYIAGGGSDTSINNDAFTSTACMNNDINATFLQMMGSYFVEWNNGGLHVPNQLMRSPLAATGQCLATMWTGYLPYWNFHHMAMGEPLGFSVKNSQNNLNTYFYSTTPSGITRGVHMALMGDPTLRLHIIAPVSNVKPVANSNTVDINWAASNEAGISGYYIYRANTFYGAFVRINTQIITGTSYTDNSPLSGNNIYMIRPIKLEQTPSGTYYNMGTGIMDSVIYKGVVTNNCNNTSTGLPPLNDLGANYYRGVQGGLYPNGYNVCPTTHQQAGRNIALNMQPIDTNGNLDTTKNIIWLSVGMSNTGIETKAFLQSAKTFPGINPKLKMINGSVGGHPSQQTRNANDIYWPMVDSALRVNGSSPNQVQVIWLKTAYAGPTDSIFHHYADTFKQQIKDMVIILKQRYPNLKMCYLSSRIYAGYATNGLNPEPYAWQSGLSVKWLIEDQINADISLNFQGQNIQAPWLAWGPYLWADGTTPRKDGLTWICPNDYNSDGTHPSATGSAKVSQLLLNFFSTDSTATPWFYGTTKSVNNTSLGYLPASENLTLYPNPTNGKIYINNHEILSSLIRVYDITGKEILAQKVNIDQHIIEIDLSPFAPGIYMMKIDNTVVKVVKEE